MSYDPYLPDEATEAWRGEGTYLWSLQGCHLRQALTWTFSVDTGRTLRSAASPPLPPLTWRAKFLEKRGSCYGCRVLSPKGRLPSLGRPVLSWDWSSGSKSEVTDRAQQGVGLGTTLLSGAGPGPGWETSPPLAPVPEKLPDFSG